ncbi:MAG: EAL domain-containing protein [Actinomycetota bacterium]
MGPDFIDALDDGSGRFSLVSVPLMPTPDSVAAVGIAMPGDHRADFAMLTDLAATFADLLSQLRSRLALESAEARRAESQHFLREAAATLAEASDPEYDDAVHAVLADAVEFLGLDELSTWRADPVAGHFIARHAVGGVDAPGATLPFGIDATMDAALRDHRVAERTERIDATQVTTIALPRGTAPTVTLMTACHTGANGITEHERLVLGELSRLFGQIEERIAGERYSQTAFGQAPIGIVLCDPQWRVITCNPAFATFLGYRDPGDLVGVSSDALLDTDDRSPLGGSQELPLRRADGRRVWAICHSTAIEGVLSGEPMWLVHVEDITERRRADQLLRFQATHDELTGLANRRQLRTLCEERLVGAGSTAVLLLDLDRFKLINDSLGHDRGDEMLVAVADRLRLAVRPGDVVARLGGDEFAVLLSGPVDHVGAARLADRLLQLIGEPMSVGTQQVFPSASIGIAIADDDSTVADMLRRSDTAMYRAKAGGRGRHESFDEDLRDEVQDRMETEAGLRRALRHGELRVHYQPEVSLRTGRILGAEALVRWEHPTRGLLGPGAFIEVAEETGLIVDLGTQVLFEACEEAAAWDDDDLNIRVNFAAAQLQRNETVGLVAMALKRSGIAPHRLCVEITESAMMGDVEQAERILTELKGLGVRVAVDDFGTGFSSLAYLKRFPVDALKIDRAFVSGLGTEEDNAFVRSIISLAEALSLDVVAEGVETEDQVDALLRLGCHRAQGFHFARPEPAAALRARLGVDVSG